MRRRFSPAFLSAAFVAASCIAAQADPVLECSIESGSQVETADCLAETETWVNQVLDAALRIAMSSARELDDVTERDVAVPSLTASQAAWQAYLGAQCDYVGATYGGGSGTGIAIRACRVELTRARIAQLLSLSN